MLFSCFRFDWKSLTLQSWRKSEHIVLPDVLNGPIYYIFLYCPTDGKRPPPILFWNTRKDFGEAFGHLCVCVCVKSWLVQGGTLNQPAFQITSLVRRLSSATYAERNRLVLLHFTDIHNPVTGLRSLARLVLDFSGSQPVTTVEDCQLTVNS